MTREIPLFDLSHPESSDQQALFEQGGSIPVLLRRIVDAYGLRNAAYLAVNLPGVAPSSPYIASTYPDAWVAHYKSQAYHRLDPVVVRGFDSLLPVDWATLDKSAPRVRCLFGEAREHGVGRHGLLFPIRGRHGERAIFTVSADETDQAWLNIRRQLAREFQIVAHRIHQIVLSNETIPPSPVHLSRREVECLRWAAAGRTQPEVATILGIGERTVLHYIEAARAKLEALNTTHAVAKAISMNLITIGV